MSVFEEPEWWSLIDKDAAIAEQFPPIEKVRLERPGGPLAKQLDAAHRRRVEGRVKRDRLRGVQEAEADRFIAEIEARTGEKAKRRRLAELDKERRDVEREIRAAERRLAWLSAMSNRIERKTA